MSDCSNVPGSAVATGGLGGSLPDSGSFFRSEYIFTLLHCLTFPFLCEFLLVSTHFPQTYQLCLFKLAVLQAPFWFTFPRQIWARKTLCTWMGSKNTLTLLISFPRGSHAGLTLDPRLRQHYFIYLYPFVSVCVCLILTAKFLLKYIF